MEHTAGSQRNSSPGSIQQVGTNHDNPELRGGLLPPQSRQDENQKEKIHTD